MRILHLLLPCLFLFGCSDDAECTVDDAESCDDGLVCENVGVEPTCVKPVYLKGRVLDTAGAGIANARVTAVDANDAPVTGTAISAADGTYELRVPIASRSDKDAVPTLKVKLRAAAQ